MADIFISYSREDREWVSHLANSLEAEGFSVWWDWDLLVGKRYRETIENELQICKATVVVWSTHSIKSDFVRDEAEEGQQRNILVPLLKESVRPPAGFRQLQTADLSTWNGAADHIEFRRMMKGVSHLIGREAKGGSTDVQPDGPPLHRTDAAPPTPVTPPTPTPIPVADPAPQPIAPVATHAAAAVAPAPVTHTAPVSLATMPPKTHNPVLRYVAIGAVVLIALIFVAVQFIPASKPGQTVHGPATTGGTTAGGGTTGGTTGTTGSTTGSSGSRPSTGGSTGGTGTDGGGTQTGGTETGGDEGQSGPHHGSSSGSGGESTTPPQTEEGGDEGQSH